MRLERLIYMAEDSIGITEINNREHISPNKTGDNISAKKTANYVWNTGTSSWDRMTQPGGTGGGGDGAINDGVSSTTKATVRASTVDGTKNGLVVVNPDGSNIGGGSGGGLTDTQLRASAVPVSLATAPTTPVTGTFWQATQPVSIASMPSTPITGTVTETNSAAILSKLPTPGQTTMANSQPVVIASNQSAIQMQGYQPTANSFTGVIATGAQASTLATGFNVATVTLRTFTGTTPSITFKLEASDDNTNWVTIQGINNSTGLVGITFTQAAALTAGTAGPSIDFTVGAYTNVRINVTAISGTSATAAFGLGFQSMPYEASPGAIAQGAAANATAIAGAGNPQVVAFSDGTNVRYPLVNTSGHLNVIFPSAQAISGTVTANGGTSFTTPAVSLTGDTGAKVATGNGATQTNASGKGVIAIINLGTVSGTAPTAVFKLQGSADSGTTWYDIPGATTATLATTGVFGISVYPSLTAVSGTTVSGSIAAVSQGLPKTWRVVWTIGGTTPSFTVTNIQVNYLV